LDNQNIIIRVATPDDVHYAETITNEMAESAQARGTVLPNAVLSMWPIK
jgi:hypothetical protein